MHGAAGCISPLPLNIESWPFTVGMGVENNPVVGGGQGSNQNKIIHMHSTISSTAFHSKIPPGSPNNLVEQRLSCIFG